MICLRHLQNLLRTLIMNMGDVVIDDDEGDSVDLLVC